MVDTIYSIGYSGFSIDDFINSIRSKEISAVVDVRSLPYSKFFSDYNKDCLEQKLKRAGIFYRNYATEFGAKQDEKRYFSKENYLDFELFAKSISFLKGFDKLKDGMAQNYSFVLMCAEKDPINCHRTILVSRCFHDAGYKVIHLLPNNITMTQDAIENRLLKKYFPNIDKNQTTLFDNIDNSYYISRAYKKRNAEIGCSIGEEENMETI